MSIRSDSSWLGRLARGDIRVLHALIGRRSPGLDRFMRIVTRLGDPVPSIGIVLGLMIAGSSQVRHAGTIGAIALAISHFLVQLLKRTISRPRPQLPVGVESLIRAPDRFSFPSGHSAAALSVALAVSVLFAAPTGTLIAGIGLLVGVSRCYLGVHYPGDVIAGWILALLGLALAVTF